MTWTGRSDVEVWRGVLAADPSAAAEIFDRHADRVFAHCARLLTSRVDAEDAASIVFFEAWNKGDGVRFVDDSLLPWLLVTATNTARNLLRGQRRYRARLAQLPPPDAVGDVADEVVRRLDAVHDRRRVAAALATLPPGAHQVVSLCDLSGLSYAEAAEALGVPIGTVRSRLSRAREQLRHRLSDAATADITARGGQRP